VRHVLNPYLARVGGHVGYGVRQRARRRRHATDECPRQGSAPNLTNLSASAVPNAPARRVGTDPTIEVKQGAAPAALPPLSRW